MDLTVERLEQMKEDFKSVPMIGKEEWEKGSPTVDAFKKQNGGFYREARDLIHLRSEFQRDVKNELKIRQDELARERTQFQKNVRELEGKRGPERDARRPLPMGREEKDRVRQTVKELEEKERKAARSRMDEIHKKRAQRVLPRERTAAIRQPIGQREQKGPERAM